MVVGRGPPREAGSSGAEAALCSSPQAQQFSCFPQGTTRENIWEKMLSETRLCRDLENLTAVRLSKAV